MNASTRGTGRQYWVALRALLIFTVVLGVAYRPASASSILSRNLLIYGLGGIIAPFIGIKLIDLVVSFIPGF